MSNQNRVNPGIPTGGQFATNDRPESAVALDVKPTFPVFHEINRQRRGQKFFVAEMRKWPAIGSTDGDGDLADKTIVGHFFGGPVDYYVAEYDPQTGEAFGWADLGHGGEWGYFDLREIEALNVKTRQGYPLIIERETYFVKQPANKCISKYVEDAKAAAAGAIRAAELLAEDAVTHAAWVEDHIGLGTTPARAPRSDLMIDDEVARRAGQRELTDVTALAIARQFDRDEYPELAMLGASGHGQRSTAYAELSRFNEDRARMTPRMRARVDALFTWLQHGGDNN